MVKCAECGFLCFKAWEDGVFKEADREFRRGDLRTYHSPNEPVCFARAFDLQEELAQTEGSSTDFHARFMGIVTRDRNCNSFTKWHQGFSPKEHREMLDRQWLLDREDKRDTDTREWQAEQEVKRRSFQLWLAVLSGLMLLVAAMVGALYGAYVQQVVNPPNITIQMPVFTPTPIPTFTPTPTPAPTAPTPAS